MIHVETASSLESKPQMSEKMFCDRAAQFRSRLKWNVCVDDSGRERDQYDNASSIYIVASSHDNPHVGSIRLRPTEGATMVRDIFGASLPVNWKPDPHTWEATRLCVDPQFGHGGICLVLAGCAATMQYLGVKKLIGIFNRKMLRVYRRMVLEPEVLGSCPSPEEEVFAGTWTFSTPKKAILLKKAQTMYPGFDLSLSTSTYYVDESSCPQHRICA